MNSSALMLAFYFRSAVTAKRTFISPYRAGTAGEYYRARIQTLNQVFEVPAKAWLDLPSEEDKFPDVCLCGQIFSEDGMCLRRFCKHCLGRKSSRDVWEFQNFYDFFRSYYQVPVAAIVELYYAKAVWLESMRQANQANQAKG